MTDLEKSKLVLATAKQHVENAKRAFREVEGAALLSYLSYIVAEHPELRRLGWDAFYEYDDEGSYSWHVSPTVSLDGGELENYENALDYGRGATLYGLLEDLYDFSIDAWLAAGDDDSDNEHGEIDLAVLRS